MNRTTFDAMLAQYKKQDVSGEGAVSWDKGVHCVLPEVIVGGKAVQDGTPTPDAPVMPEFSAGTEVVSRGNLFDALGANVFSGACYISQISEDGDITVKMKNSGTYRSANVLVPIFPSGTEMVLSAKWVASGANQGAVRLMWFNESKTALSGFGNLSASGGFTSFTMPERPKDALYCGIALYGNWNGTGTIGDAVTYSEIMLSIGTTPTPYEPYFDGGTATAPELLAIPGTDIRDEWDAQTGKGVRRVEKLVLDGTEAWKLYGTQAFFYIEGLPKAYYIKMCFSSHFVYQYIDENDLIGLAVFPNGIMRIRPQVPIPPVDDWKAYLAAQYAAGTPVTVWYALKEPIPFQTAPAPLTAPKGTGHIMQVGGTLDAVPITAKYVTHS